MLLEGKIALVTGGSRGIGLVVAEEFLKEGASVCISARKIPLEVYSSLVKDYGDDRVAIAPADVTIPQMISFAVQRIEKKFGRIDILVNAAGVHGTIGSFTEVNTEEWDLAIRVNLLGTANTMRVVLPYLVKQGSGKIINFSGGGATSPRPHFSAYAAAKTAIVRLTETVALELKEKNLAVDVNAIAPGAVLTKLHDEIISAGPELSGKKEYDAALNRQMTGGEDPKKAAALAVFLASPLSNGLSGKLISAIWDRWEKIPQHFTQIMNSDIFTLRRIVTLDGRAL